MTVPNTATILAIDDSLTIRKLVDMILKAVGYTVILAEKGEEGLRLAREHKPDLILLDYVLPDLPSPEICKQLLAYPDTATIPILLISTNGAAIRQLYTDSSNVKDYLTKPFQAKVLQSVIAHLLSRPKQVESGLAEAEVKIPASAPSLPVAAIGAVNLDSDADAPVLDRPTLIVPTVAPIVPAMRGGAGQAAAQSNDAHAFLRTLLNLKFRALARMIPDLEARRGRLPAETYYLPFLLRNELLSDIAAEMGRAQFITEHGEPLIAGTADWMSIDATLLHLARTAATGLFSIKLPQENIEIILRQGQVVSISSDNAKAYCFGAAYNFRSLAPAAITAAVSAQQRARVPFFVTLHRGGFLRDTATALGLLREQGARALHRALATPAVRYSYTPRENVADLGVLSLAISPRQIVLEALRFVEDWLEIESATGSVDTVFRLIIGTDTHFGDLSLTLDERAVVDMIDGVRPLHEVAAASGLGLYEACAAVYRFLKLQIVAVETAAAPVADISVEDFLSETAPDSWSPGPSSAPLSTPINPNPKPSNPPSTWPKF
jgi:CheY-like chemotaxis protein